MREKLDRERLKSIFPIGLPWRRLLGARARSHWMRVQRVGGQPDSLVGSFAESDSPE